MRKPNGQERKVVVLSKKRLDDKGVDNKYIVEAHTLINGNEGERTMRLVEKELKVYEFLERNDDDIPADKYLKYWRELQDAGIPTVPTMRKLDDERVIMTDLTAEGGCLYGKNKSLQMTGDKNSIDDIFLSIDPEEITKQAQEIVEKANKAGISLPMDDPLELLVNPDGTWRLLVLDLSMLEFRLEQRSVIANNEEAIDFFNHQLQIIRQGLS